MMELSVTIDAALPFVTATYALEGDEPLALNCYETISALDAAARHAYYPNTIAVACRLSAGNVQMERELLQHAKSCV